MQFSTILPIAFCLVASTLANPMALPANHHGGAGAGAAAKVVSAQVKANVSAQIDKWLSDIESVNTFVDTVGSVTNPAIISSMAATAFVAAQNEGASNTILQQDVTLDACGQAAAQALIGQFNIIGPAINDTIFNPGNVKKNLDAINGARCPPPQGAGAISQEGDVQAAAASAVGIAVSPPQTPTACTAATAATN
ncbi:uncharacterized protein PAC_01294 [Phialocephala subalpina]|uniref:Uncharacterized protein n=1 Tax=Phialocephala subalpina TaxID=576137 RepID=A0A1L7WF86_9HELO|nr:uncharacterized protein PAC_01294 [Phialocephala subalpina]